MSPSEAAAHWLVLQDRRLLSADERAEFEQWRKDAVHAEAWRRVSGAMALFDGDLSGDANLKALRQAALEATPQPAPRYRYFVAGAAIAASIALLVSVSGLHQSHDGQVAGTRGGAPAMASSTPVKAVAGTTEYRTGIGERRTVRLADGSMVTMNTRTRLAVLFTANRRLIRLMHGQALFEVIHDATRPFTVQAADRQVTALGTIFEVRVDPGRVKVVLIRGRVVVDRSPESSGGFDDAHIRPTILKPGQQFDAELGAPQKVAAIDIDRQQLWRNGFVEFDDEPLGRAVAEINRYTARPIILSNDGVAALHVSGLYRTGSPDQFIDAVQGLLPVEAKANAEGGIALSLTTKRLP
jgi:transmembrane sensor